MSEPLRIVVFKDDGVWIAQCLERDIGTQASDLNTLFDRMVLTLECEQRSPAEFSKIPPAPQEFFDMWERRSKHFEQFIKSGEISGEMVLIA